MASAAGKRRSVAPARFSEDSEQSKPKPLATEEEAVSEPKKRRRAPAKEGKGVARRGKKVKGEEVEKEKERGKEDQEKAEGGTTGAEEAKEEGQKQEEQPSRFLEKGLVYFFYRPKVGVEEVHDLAEVQKLYMLLIPKETMRKEDLEHRKHRMILITKKKLPEVHSHARYWGFVEETSDEMKAVRNELGAVTYSTKTRGERTLEAARPAGRGYYGIITHENHTHLAYVLELPEEIGEVQEAFNIAKEGSYIVAVKNPSIHGPAGLAPKEKEELPPELVDRFGDKRWLPLDPPSFLDFKGTELIIIGASDDLKAELGKTGEQLEKLEEADVALGLTDETVFEELHLDKSRNLPEPLVEGEWK
jgi:hypothetical protein